VFISLRSSSLSERERRSVGGTEERSSSDGSTGVLALVAGGLLGSGLGCRRKSSVHEFSS